MYKDKFISAVITAAGSGSRVGAGIPKLELKISGKTIIEHTVFRILSSNLIDEIILVTSNELIDEYKKRFFEIKNLKVVLGGSSREESTFNGLNNISENSDIVLCHDGARPNVSTEIIKNSIDSAIENGAAITAVKVKDTIKFVENGFVNGTLDRSNLYQVQTPQVFNSKLLKKGYGCGFGKIKSTDDSAFVEALGEKVAIVEGSYENFKITTQIDYQVMKMLLEDL